MQKTRFFFFTQLINNMIILGIPLNIFVSFFFEKNIEQ